MVAAWISADAGVGPAIASGSQVWSGNWADLPTTPAKRQQAATRSKPWLTVPLSATSLIFAMSKDCPAMK